MISVAMATYNSMKYIEIQLDSIREQTVPVDEVVIVDDHSTDETVSYIEQYIDQFGLSTWKVHKHAENAGYIRTFTDALSRVQGDIVILCDHDDIWEKTKVETIAKAYENTEVLALATSFVQIDGEGKEVPVKLKAGHANNNLIRRSVERGALNKMDLADVSIYNIAPGCTCAVRKSLVDTYLQEEHALPHDWKLNLLAACKGGLYYLDQVTTGYRVHGANTIGLGHQSAFEKRQKIVANNLTEKKEALRIVREYLADDTDALRHFEDIEKIFEKRNDFMQQGKLTAWLSAMVRSLGKGRLYESVMMDLISKYKS